MGKKSFQTAGKGHLIAAGGSCLESCRISVADAPKCPGVGEGISGGSLWEVTLTTGYSVLQLRVEMDVIKSLPAASVFIEETLQFYHKPGIIAEDMHG